MEPKPRKRLAFVILFFFAVSAFPQKSQSPNSNGRDDSLPAAQAAVSQARQQVEEDDAVLSADQKAFRSTCKKQGPNCDAAKAKVSADLQTVKIDKANPQQVWAHLVPLLHGAFKSALPGEGAASGSGGGQGQASP
jgi:hypothetical protein